MRVDGTPGSATYQRSEIGYPKNIGERHRAAIGVCEHIQLDVRYLQVERHCGLDDLAILYGPAAAAVNLRPTLNVDMR